jgi:hypothetical protein
VAGVDRMTVRSWAGKQRHTPVPAERD